MTPMRKLLFLIYFPTVLYACSTANNSSGKRDVSQFPPVSPQAQTRLLHTGLSTPEQMTIYKDSLLLVVNNLNTNPYHVRVFDIARQKTITNLFPASSKKGGTLSFMSFNISDSLIWVFDVAKNGFIVANLDTLLKSNGGLEHYSEYRLTPQVFYYDALLLNREEALLSGNYDTDEKLAYIRLSDSKSNKQIMSYQNDSSIGSSRVNKMSYESFMLLKPDKKKLLLACRYADQLELTDLISGKYKKIKGPEGFSPKFVPFTNNAGITEGTLGLDTRYGFLKGHVTAKYCYLLFSGHHYRSIHRFYGNKILVYDWEGNPVKQIILKNDIVDFAVTTDDRMLYTLDQQTKTIGFSSLK